jgi:preprotein translocase subunit YajC
VSFVLIMVLLLVVMYVVMIRPQRQRQAQTQSQIDSAGVGDDILTTGGIYGTIVDSEGDDIEVELAEGMRVHMTRRAIAAVLPPEGEDQEEGEEPEVVDGEPVEEAEPGEGVVVDGEEPVRSGSGVDTDADSRL